MNHTLPTCTIKSRRASVPVQGTSVEPDCTSAGSNREHAEWLLRRGSAGEVFGLPTVNGLQVARTVPRRTKGPIARKRIGSRAGNPAGNHGSCEAALARGGRRKRRPGTAEIPLTRFKVEAGVGNPVPLTPAAGLKGDQ